MSPITVRRALHSPASRVVRSVSLAITLGLAAASIAAGQVPPRPLEQGPGSRRAGPLPEEPSQNGITRAFMRAGKVPEMGAPALPATESVDIPPNTARDLAMARARRLWGGSPTLISVTPLTDGLGRTIAYDVDLRLDGERAPSYQAVASDWQKILSAQDGAERTRNHRKQGETNKAEAEPPVPPPSHPYASITVSATYDAYPIRAARRGVSNYYGSAWIAKTVALKRLSSADASLSEVVLTGPWERSYRFTAANGASVLAKGHEPWDAVAYDKEALGAAWDARRRAVRKSIQDAGLVPDQEIDKVRLAHRAAVDTILNESGPSASVTYISGWNTWFEPYEWHYGCSPTAAAMVLNYWDNRDWYGKLTVNYFTAVDAVEGDTDCHVANAQAGLATDMQTDGSGYTQVQRIYTGMRDYANDRGYGFSGGSNWNGDEFYYGWHWDDMVADIDNDRPFVWSLWWFPGTGGAGHSVAAVGYDSSTHDILSYNTWRTSGNVPQRAYYAGSFDDHSYGQAPLPGGPVQYSVRLTSLDGLHAFATCGSSGFVVAGAPATITWTNFSRPGTAVRIYYSTNGGADWALIAQAPDTGSYVWNVPNISTSQARIDIDQYASSGWVSSDGSYGDFSIVPTFPVTGTVGTSPTGPSFSVDGTTYTSEQSFTWDAASSHTIGTTTPQSGGPGKQYVFSSWSDGKPMTHTVAPTASFDYSAAFFTQYTLTMAAGPGGTVTPASSWQYAGNTVQVTATPDSGYAFAGWTGTGTGSYSGTDNPATVTMNGPIAQTAVFVPIIAVTVEASIAGRSFSVDARTYTSAQTFNWPAGSNHTIATTSPQAGTTGTQYVWSNWSDGGAISHTIAPTSPATYTATFTTQFYLTMTAGPNGHVKPGSAWFDAGEGVAIVAAGNTGYEFLRWTGAGEGSYSGTSEEARVRMTGPISETATFSPAVSVTVQASPAGPSFTVDGVGYTSAHTFSWAAGSSHSIATASPQAGTTGTQYVWSSWSDGRAMSHSVTVDNPVTYTANFATQYLLTVSAGSGGTASPVTGFYDSGQSVEVSANPAAGYAFVSWTGTGKGSYSGFDNPARVTMDGPITETASFSPLVSVTVQTDPAGRSFTVDGTAYTTAQTFSWASGSNHAIATTSPQAGATGSQYVFKAWSDGGALAHTVSPTGATTYTAGFTTQYYLTMAAGTGGTVDPASGWFGVGDPVQLIATPASGYAFSGWTGSGTGSYSGANNPASVTMNGPMTETASFTPLVSVTVQTDPAGRSFTVDGTAYTTAQTFSWASGSNHTIATTSPQAGTTGSQYVFKGWSGGGALAHTVAPTGPTTYTAGFTTQYYLTMAAGTGGTVDPASGWFGVGDPVRLIATPASGYAFSGWTGSGTGSYSGANNPASVTMNGPIAQTATFVAHPELVFTEDPLSARTTPMKAVHITELRVAIDALRAQYRLSAITWTDPTLTPDVTTVKAAHLAELRAALNAVYVAAGRTPPTYTTPAIVGGATIIRAVDIQELRAAVRAIW